MKRSFENSLELSRRISDNLPDLEISFDQIRKDDRLFNKAKELERHLIDAHDLLWDLKLGLVGVRGEKVKADRRKKRRGRPAKKKADGIIF